MVWRESRYEAEYESIKEIRKTNKYNLSLCEMCKAAGIKRANYYKWLHREKNDHDLENEELLNIIREYEEESDYILGYRMMTDKINREKNKNYSDKRIYKIMRISGIQSWIRRRPKSCTVRKNNNTAENILKRDFNAEKPNEKWVTDATEFKYWQRANTNCISVHSLIYMIEQSLDMRCLIQTIMPLYMIHSERQLKTILEPHH